MSESIHQWDNRANGRSDGEAGSNGSQDGHVVDLIHRLTEGKFTTDREASEGSHGQASTSVMGILVGEGLQMANKAGSKVDFTKIAKQFLCLASDKTEEVDLKFLGDSVAEMVRTGAAAAVASEEDCEGASAAVESIASKTKAIMGLKSIEEDIRTVYGGTRGTNPLTQSQKIAIGRIAERAGKVRGLYERLHVYETSERRFREQSFRAVSSVAQAGTASDSAGEQQASLARSPSASGGTAASSPAGMDGAQIEKHLKACIAGKQRIQQDIYEQFARVKIDEKTAANDLPLATSIVPEQRKEKCREIELWLEEPGTVYAYWAIIPEIQRILCVADKKTGIPAKPEAKVLKPEIWGSDGSDDATKALLALRKKQDAELGLAMLRKAEADNNIEMKSLFKGGKTALGSPENRIMYDVKKGSGLSQVFAMMAQYTASTTSISRKEMQDEVDMIASHFCGKVPMESALKDIKEVLRKGDEMGVYPSWNKAGMPALMVVKSRGTSFVTACELNKFTVNGKYSREPDSQDVTKFLLDLTTLVKTVEDEEKILDEYRENAKRLKTAKSTMALDKGTVGISEECMEELKVTHAKSEVPKESFERVKKVLKDDAELNGNKLNMTKVRAEITAGHILLKNGQTINMENIRKAKNHLVWKRKRDENDDKDDDKCVACGKNKRARAKDGHIFPKCDECFQKSRASKGAKGSKGSKGKKGGKGEFSGRGRGRGKGRGGRGDGSERGGRGARKDVQTVRMIDRDGKISSKKLDKKTLDTLKKMRESGSRQISKEEEKVLKKNADEFDVSEFLG